MDTVDKVAAWLWDVVADTGAVYDVSQATDEQIDFWVETSDGPKHFRVIVEEA